MKSLELFNFNYRFGFIKIYHTNNLNYTKFNKSWIGDYIPLDDSNGFEINYNMSIGNVYDEAHKNEDEEVYVSQLMYFYHNKIEIEDENKLVKKTQDFPLCIVSTIQFAKNSFLSEENPFDFISEILNEKSKNDKDERKLFEFQIMHSLDSYDFILIFYSNNIKIIIDILAHIMYSKPGSVCFSFVGYRDGVSWNEEIDLAFIRIVFKSLNQLVSNYSSNLFYALGIDDLLLPLEKIKSDELIAKIKKYYTNNDYYRFSMVLGVKLKEFSNSISSKEHSIIPLSKNRSIQNINLSVQILNQLTRPVKETLTSLKNMLSLLQKSNLNYPLEDMLVYSFKGFNKILNDNINHKCLKTEIHSDFIPLYINEVYNLLSNTLYGYSYNFHISNSSVFTRDIPSKLLQSYYIFATKVSQILRNETTESKIKYFYLLIPGYYRNLTTKNIFGEFPPKERLLVMQLPNETIFKPKILLPTLIHEIAHYSGDECRHRKLRFDCLSNLLVSFIVSDIMRDDRRKEIKEINQKWIDFLAKLLKKSIKVHANNRFKCSEYYIFDVSNFFIEYLNDLKDYSIIKEQIIQVVSNWNTNARKFIEDEILSRDQINIFKTNLDSAYDILSETYADVISISVLQINEFDYLSTLCENYVTEIGSDLFYFRLNLLCKIFKWNFTSLQNKDLKVYNLVKSYHEWYIQNDCLKSYLVDCLFPYFINVIETIKTKEDDFKDIRKLYNDLY